MAMKPANCRRGARRSCSASAAIIEQPASTGPVEAEPVDHRQHRLDIELGRQQGSPRSEPSGGRLLPCRAYRRRSADGSLRLRRSSGATAGVGNGGVKRRAPAGRSRPPRNIRPRPRLDGQIPSGDRLDRHAKASLRGRARTPLKKRRFFTIARMSLDLGPARSSRARRCRGSLASARASPRIPRRPRRDGEAPWRLAVGPAPLPRRGDPLEDEIIFVAVPPAAARWSPRRARPRRSRCGVRRAPASGAEGRAWSSLVSFGLAAARHCASDLPPGQWTEGMSRYPTTVPGQVLPDTDRGIWFPAAALEMYDGVAPPASPDPTANATARGETYGSVTLDNITDVVTAFARPERRHHRPPARDRDHRAPPPASMTSGRREAAAWRVPRRHDFSRPRRPDHRRQAAGIHPARRHPGVEVLVDMLTNPSLAARAPRPCSAVLPDDNPPILPARRLVVRIFRRRGAGALRGRRHR